MAVKNKTKKNLPQEKREGEEISKSSLISWLFTRRQVVQVDNRPPQSRAELHSAKIKHYYFFSLLGSFCPLLSSTLALWRSGTQLDRNVSAVSLMPTTATPTVRKHTLTHMDTEQKRRIY